MAAMNIGAAPFPAATTAEGSSVAGTVESAARINGPGATASTPARRMR